jgi:type IV secretory pathway ATPase VirB11/archaellum biosynthesis ATPase
VAKVQFTAFVEDAVTNRNGEIFVIKTAETHRKQVDNEWVTVGRTFRQVKAAWEVPISFAEFPKGARVDVVGTEVTEVREYEGRKFYDLVVKADSVVASGGPQAAGWPAVNQPAVTTESFNSDAPF